MGRGILWVKSWVESTEDITPERLCTWYEEVHIQEALSLAGFPSATRWELPVPTQTGPWLTIFTLPEISYKDSPAFHALHNAVPSQELIEGVYAHVGFDIRFYEEVACQEEDDAEGKVGRFLSSEEYSGEEEGTEGRKKGGWLRTRQYRLASRVVLRRLQREEGEGKGYLTLREFEEGVEEEGWYRVKRIYPESEWGDVGVE